MTEELKKIHDLLVVQHRKLVAKMIKGKKAGKDYLEEDRITLLQLTKAINLVKMKIPAPAKSVIQRLIDKYTEE